MLTGHSSMCKTCRYNSQYLSRVNELNTYVQHSAPGGRTPNQCCVQSPRPEEIKRTCEEERTVIGHTELWNLEATT